MKTILFYRFGTLTAVLAAALLTSCSKAPSGNEFVEHQEDKASAPTASDRVFEVKGVLHGVDWAARTVTIEHEDIPGFMPAMTMPFSVKNLKEFEKIEVGQAVAFEFTVTSTDSWIDKVHTVDRASVRLPEDKVNRASNAPRIKEGDAFPEFNLVDEASQPLTREFLGEKATIVTFIFTRCPIPNFCPLMQQNLADLQKKVAADAALAAQVQFLSISFDPEDSPEMLAKYAAAFTENTTSWKHASGSKEETEKLTHAFSVYVQAESGSYTHGLCTALVLPGGKVHKIWRGNDWKIDEVWTALQGLNAPGKEASK